MYYILPLHLVNEEKLNNGYTITSLKLYIPKLSCICWHTGVAIESSASNAGGY